MLPFSRRLVRNPLLLGGSAALMFAACTPVERDLSQLKSSATGGAKSQVAGSPGTSQGGLQLAGAGGSIANTAVTGGGNMGIAGAANAGGANTSALGGTLSAFGGSIQGGDAAIAGSAAMAAGGAIAQGGTTSSSVVDVGGRSSIIERGGTGNSIGVGGLLNLGGLLNNIGGFFNTQAGAPDQGGALSQGGVTNQGGASSQGGVANPAGGVNQGGVVVNAGGASTCVPSGNEVCNDGIDNDCNGAIDCPIVNGRYPEPGRACAGDDAWVQLTQPMRPLKAVECHTGKPNVVGTKPWVQCDPSNPMALKVYSMGAVEAQLGINDGVNVFEFRFRYDNGSVSEARQIVYYAHSSLWDGVAGTPALECQPVQPDNRYFETARSYLIGSTTVPAFAQSDAYLKNPFIELRFYPSFLGTFDVPSTGPRVVKVLSLRHRFVLDASRQLLLVTRSYQSSHNPSVCSVATISDHDSWDPTQHLRINRLHNRATCEAVVFNSAGAGLCLGSWNGTIQIQDQNSSKIVTFLQSLTPPFSWPKTDPMMWQKLFDDRPSRGGLQFFSNKCMTDDVACRTAHPGVSVLVPDSTDPYFTSP